MARNFINSLLNRQQQAPFIAPIQMGADGKEDVPASLALQNQMQPLTLKDRLIGRELYKDVDVQGTPDENGQAEVSTQRFTNFRPGLLNDLASGYRENYATGFAAPNWGQDQTADGRQKGFGYRLGEGLGSVGRFIDSPVGRGLIAAGLNSALGYDNSLQEGLTAAVGRQTNQTADRLYRQQLKQMGYTDEDLAGIKGNITKDMFSTLAMNNYRLNSLRVRQDIASATDNTKRANIIMQGLNNGTITPQEAQIQMANYGITLDDLQKSNATRNTEVSEFLAPARQYAYITAPQVALGNLGVAQGRLGLDVDKFIASQEDKNAPGEGEKVLAQLDQLKNLYDQLPQNKAGKGGQKAVAAATGAASQLGLRSDEVAAFEGVSNMVTNLVARKLAGEKGVMTDKDFDRAKKMVPSVYDSPQQAQAKMNAIKQLYYAEPQGGGARATSNNNAIINKLKGAGYSDEKIQQYLKAKGLQ